MRKKIIKSYFFKNKNSNPAITSIFCFSKRAIKQKKILQKTVTHNVYKNQHKYNILIKAYIRYNFWLLNKQKLLSLFMNSFFSNNDILKSIKASKNNPLIKIKIWYRFKRKYLKLLNLKSIRFPHTGVLSSHFVHFISKKNLTYQTRSKYRAKNFNMNIIGAQTLIYITILYNYLLTNNMNIFFFNKALDKKYLNVDEDFNVTASAWENNIFSSKKLFSFTKHFQQNNYIFVPINKYDSVLERLQVTKGNWDNITSYLNETDMNRKENIYKDLANLITPIELNNIIIIYQTIFNFQPFNVISTMNNHHFYYDCTIYNM